MLNLKKVANLTVLVFALSAFSTNFALAKVTTPGKLNAKGWEACQQLGDKGYTAKIRGKQYHGSNFFDGFNIRFCFASANECNRFINNINHVIYPIEEIRYANCKKS